MDSRPDITGAYRVERTDIKVPNPRRGPSQSVPGLDFSAAFQVMDSLFAEFGLEDEVGCVTAEGFSRPVPHVFRSSETQALTDLFERREPEILARIMRELKYPLQVFPKQSRLGWPFQYRPEEPDTKKSVLAPFFRDLVANGADATMADAYITMNVRLQDESRLKMRDMLYVTEDGSPYLKPTGEKARTVPVQKTWKRVGSRTRLVFNLPCANLYKQPFDTAAHHVMLQYPAFRFNMYSDSGVMPLGPHRLFLDVKHFERHTASAARLRARLIGGLYADISERFKLTPFLCPSDNWKQTFLMWPNHDAGWSDQFASGDSAVAPVQKEIFTALYMEFAETHLGVSPHDSLSWAWLGGDERLRIRNYGDDNALDGDPAVLRDCLSFLSGFLSVEEEDPEKFLGFLWTSEGFKLGVKSYLSKTYLNERRPYSFFRQFPMFGWVEKRKIYAAHGVDDLITKVFPREAELLAEHGMPWSEVQSRGAEEAQLASSMSGVYTNPSWLLEKDYQLTPEEKLQSGLFEGYDKEETREMIRSVVGSHWLDLLQ
jgi:hypothetical protein